MSSIDVGFEREDEERAVKEAQSKGGSE